MQPIIPNLIADIGASEGDDTHYYLQKGFDVVVVEADPVMHVGLRRRFANEIADGQVELLNRVAADTSGQEVQFWRNERYQALSTLDFGAARFQEHLVACTVPTMNWTDVAAVRGVPYYCKLDIEGGEVCFLRSMQGTDAYPTYISAECHTFEPIQVMFELGYSRFKLVNQTVLPALAASLPNPPLEGKYVPEPDWTHASGPFGRELPDRWLDFEEIAVIFDMITRLKEFQTLAASCWFDCHAWRGE